MICNITSGTEPRELIAYMAGAQRDEHGRDVAGTEQRARLIGSAGFGFQVKGPEDVSRALAMLRKDVANQHSPTKQVTKTVLHTSLAWHPGYVPSRSEMLRADKHFAKAFGMEDARRISYSHNDKEQREDGQPGYSHMHTAWGLVNRKTGRAFDRNQLHFKGMRAALTWERENNQITKAREPQHAIARAVEASNHAEVFRLNKAPDESIARYKIDRAAALGGRFGKAMGAYRTAMIADQKLERFPHNRRETYAKRGVVEEKVQHIQEHKAASRNLWKAHDKEEGRTVFEKVKEEIKSRVQRQLTRFSNPSAEREFSKQEAQEERRRTGQEIPRKGQETPQQDRRSTRIWNPEEDKNRKIEKIERNREKWEQDAARDRDPAGEWNPRKPWQYDQEVNRAQAIEDARHHSEQKSRKIEKIEREHEKQRENPRMGWRPLTKAQEAKEERKEKEMRDMPVERPFNPPPPQPKTAPRFPGDLDPPIVRGDDMKKWEENLARLKEQTQAQREPTLDKRIGRGDDFAGDAWRDQKTGQVRYMAVGRDVSPTPGHERHLEEGAVGKGRKDETDATKRGILPPSQAPVPMPTLEKREEPQRLRPIRNEKSHHHGDREQEQRFPSETKKYKAVDPHEEKLDRLAAQAFEGSDRFKKSNPKAEQDRIKNWETQRERHLAEERRDAPVRTALSILRGQRDETPAWHREEKRMDDMRRQDFARKVGDIEKERATAPKLPYRPNQSHRQDEPQRALPPPRNFQDELRGKVGKLDPPKRKPDGQDRGPKR